MTSAELSGKMVNVAMRDGGQSLDGKIVGVEALGLFLEGEADTRFIPWTSIRYVDVERRGAATEFA